LIDISGLRVSWCLEIGVHLLVRQWYAWNATHRFCSSNSTLSLIRRPYKYSECPASYVRSQLPRNVNLLFDARDLGFEIFPSRWIVYFPHKDPCLLRSKVEQPN
jgi:hypothetical protein